MRTKVHEDIIFGDMYLEYGPRSDVALHIVGNISLKRFITFNLDCKKSSIMILDFNFSSASSEGSNEPVHLQSMTRAFAVHVHKIW